MAIAVIPEGPRSRWERLAELALVVAIGIVVGALILSLLDAYVF